MNKRFSIIILLSGVVGLLPLNMLAAEVILSSHPAKCVSLKQGNVCYQEVHMQWRSSEAADYCLLNHEQEKPLKCWQHQDHGSLRFEFEFPETQKYVIRKAGSEDDLASTVIEVKWVYKVRRSQSSWRVF